MCYMGYSTNRGFPIHRNCTNFQNGRCMLLGIEVNPDGPACPNFTPKSMTETSLPVKSSYVGGQSYIGLRRGQGILSRRKSAGRSMDGRRDLDATARVRTYQTQKPPHPLADTPREQEIDALKKQLEETKRQLMDVKRKLENLRRYIH